MVSYTILPILLIFCIPILAILMTPFIILAKGIAKKGDRAVNEEERRMVQNIYSDLERMEKRVESLETLLIEEFRREPAGSKSAGRESPPPL